MLWLVNGNGLTVEKVRVLDGNIVGMEMWGEGRGMVYGDGVGVL